MRPGERFSRARLLHRAFLSFFFVAPIAMFLWFAGPGLRAGFTHDDLMNIHGARNQPFLSTVSDMATFFLYSHTYRPLGALVYRVIFETFGFDPLPYRIACYALMIANIAVLAVWARRMTGQWEVGLVTAAIHCYHGRLSGLYVSTGFLFDLLCFTCYFGTFAYYVKRRRLGEPMRPSQILIWMALYALTLDAKEMAVSLPPMLLAYELLVRRDWSRHALIVPAIGAAMTVAFIAGRLRGETALLSMASYTPDLRWSVFADHCGYYIQDLAYGRPWHHGTFGWIVIAVLAMGMIARSRQIALGFLLAVIGVLPIAFIDQRGLSQAYIPIAGLAFAAAVAASRMGQMLWWIFGVLPGSGCLCFPVRRFAVAAGMLALLARWHWWNGRLDFEPMFEEGRYIGSVMCEMRRALPKAEHGSKILFRSDPFPQFGWNSLFLVRNIYDDNAIDVYRSDRPADDRQYTHEFAFREGRMIDCRAQACP
ncbi:MAG: hypothetical protein U0Q16_07705 [Bryobacteraceae bacterium]